MTAENLPSFRLLGSGRPGSRTPEDVPAPTFTLPGILNLDRVVFDMSQIGRGQTRHAGEISQQPHVDTALELRETR